MWSKTNQLTLLALAGGAIGAWWLLSSKSDSRPKPPPPVKGGSGIDTVSHGDSKEIFATVIAVEVNRDTLRDGHYNPSDFNWSDGVVDDQESIMAMEHFDNWNDAWEYYKLLKDFYDDYHKEWTCPPRSVGVMTFLMTNKERSDGSPVIQFESWWRCDEP